MTEEQRKQYLAKFHKATEKWSGLLFQHFATEQDQLQHEQQVKEDVERGVCPF